MATFDTRQKQLSDGLEDQLKRSRQQKSRLNALADKIQRERSELNSFEFDKKAVDELSKIEEMNSETATLLEKYTASGNDFKTRVAETMEKANKTADSFTKTLQATNSAKANLNTISQSIPQASEALNSAQQKIKASTAEIEKHKSRLNELKEKVAVVREKANRVKLGAHLQQHSILELPINHGSAEFGSYTDAQLFFRTKRSSGEFICTQIILF